jgi:hypothetical protein
MNTFHIAKLDPEKHTTNFSNFEHYPLLIVSKFFYDGNNPYFVENLIKTTAYEKNGLLRSVIFIGATGYC